METKLKRTAIAFAASILMAACGAGYKGSASDTSGTNGATNGTGKIAKSGSVHNYNQ